MRSLKNILFLSSIFIITVAFNFQHNPPSNWYQQFLPGIGSRQITDMTFLDSLTGYAVTNNLTPSDTGYILKTTNGGDNWNYNFTINRGLTSIKFVNLNTGFACGGSGGGTTYLCKTTNAGLNWFSINSPSAAKWKDMSVLNEDTIWVVDDNSFNGGVYRTTNGGANWIVQYSAGSQNPTKIYFINGRIGFIYNNTVISKTYRTTNSGLNWTLFADAPSTQAISFIDSLNGWRASEEYVYKTTNGGVNWITQYLPTGGSFIFVGLNQMSVLNKDTIWAAGGVINLGSGRFRGVVIKTTNGGTNWGYQIPDTSINNFEYYHIQFVNKNTGWAYTSNRGIHTKLGGDSTITTVQQISSSVPKEYRLFQNYPNPFNPSTKIIYQLKTSGNITLSVNDINGKEIAKLVNQKQTTGIYSIDFDEGRYNLTSGIYFYSLQTESNTETKKMILIK